MLHQHLNATNTTSIRNVSQNTEMEWETESGRQGRSRSQLVSLKFQYKIHWQSEVVFCICLLLLL